MRLTRMQQQIVIKLRNGGKTVSDLAIALYGKNTEAARACVYTHILLLRRRGAAITLEGGVYWMC